MSAALPPHHRFRIGPGLVLALAVAGLALGACSSSGDAAREPSEPGAYAVGMTTMTFTRPSSTTGEPRVLETAIWYPSEGSSGSGALPQPSDDGPFPVVVFSHGSSGTPTHASFLTQHLASWGFVVVAPPHPGNTLQDGVCDLGCLGDSYNNRVDDVLFTLDQVLALKDSPSQPLGTIIDPDRTAITGFSFGGMTAVRTAPEHRFDAVVGIAPAAPTSLIETSRELDVPIMILSGGEDIAVPSDQVQVLFDALPEAIERYQIYLPKAKHTSFQDDCQENCELPQARAHELISRYVTAFLETYVNGDKRYRRFLDESAPPDLELTSGGR